MTADVLPGYGPRSKKHPSESSVGARSCRSSGFFGNVSRDISEGVRGAATRAAPKVVIVGGGHNGLVTAALLARQGANVTVLEKNEEVGGAAFTGQPWGPDIDVTRCSYSLGMMDQELIDDLELETRFGLEKVNQWGYFAPREHGYLQLPDDDPQLLERELTSKAGAEDLERFKNYKPTLKVINTILQTGKGLCPQGEQAQALMRELQEVSVGDILDHGFR